MRYYLSASLLTATLLTGCGSDGQTTAANQPSEVLAAVDETTTILADTSLDDTEVSVDEAEEPGETAAGTAAAGSPEADATTTTAVPATTTSEADAPATGSAWESEYSVASLSVTLAEGPSGNPWPLERSIADRVGDAPSDAVTSVCVEGTEFAVLADWFGTSSSLVADDADGRSWTITPKLPDPESKFVTIACAIGA